MKGINADTFIFIGNFSTTARATVIDRVQCLLQSEGAESSDPRHCSERLGTLGHTGFDDSGLVTAPHSIWNRLCHQSRTDLLLHGVCYLCETSGSDSTRPCTATRIPAVSQFLIEPSGGVLGGDIAPQQNRPNLAYSRTATRCS